MPETMSALIVFFNEKHTQYGYFSSELCDLFIEDGIEDSVLSLVLAAGGFSATPENLEMARVYARDAARLRLKEFDNLKCDNDE